MKTAEIVLVLAKVQAYDNRTVGEANVAAWSEGLEGVAFQDALDAVGEHFKLSDEWIKPKHVLDRVQLVRKARIAAAGPVDYPEGLTAVQEQDWRRCYHRRIGSGMNPAEALLEADRDYQISRAKQVAPMPADARRVLGSVARGFEQPAQACGHTYQRGA